MDAQLTPWGDLCYDLLPVQYTEWTHQRRTFLVSIFLDSALHYKLVLFPL